MIERDIWLPAILLFETGEQRVKPSVLRIGLDLLVPRVGVARAKPIHQRQQRRPWEPIDGRFDFLDSAHGRNRGFNRFHRGRIACETRCWSAH